MKSSKTLNFNELHRLRNFISVMRDGHVTTLRRFEDKASSGFKTSEQRQDKPDLSMSSTATCIGSLVLTGLWEFKPPDAEQLNWWQGREAEYYRKLLYEKWDSAGLPDDNEFTVGFVVEACADLETIKRELSENQELTEKREKALQILGRVVNYCNDARKTSRGFEYSE